MSWDTPLRLGPLEFATPLVLALLLALPAWWLWRRRRRPASIVFSRVGALELGPHAGRFVARALMVLRNVAVASAARARARRSCRRSSTPSASSTASRRSGSWRRGSAGGSSR